MPIASTFYDTVAGEGVKETTWAQSAQSRGGALFGVIGGDDFKVTAHPTTPYTVNVSAGKAFAHGIWDEHTGTTAVTTTAPASGVLRWDLIALRRDWQPTGGGPSALVAVRGTTSMTIPAAMEKRPGIIADQPLWLVQWQGGQTSPRQIIDLRCWVGPGGVEIAHILARSYLEFPGAAVKLGGIISRYELGANNVWSWDDRYDQTPKVPLSLTYLYQIDRYRDDGLLQEAPAAYKIGNRVHLGGVISNKQNVEFAGGIAYSLAVVPAGHRPKAVEYFTIEAAFTLCRVWVRPDGNIYFMFANKVGPLGPPNWRFSLSGISYDAA